MEQVAVIGLDIAKSVFQVHAIGAAGEVVLQRKKESPADLLRTSGPAPVLRGQFSATGRGRRPPRT
jgi:hypothetical protein